MLPIASRKIQRAQQMNRCARLLRGWVWNHYSSRKNEKYIHLNASSETWQLGSQTVQVSHLEKRFWPEVEFTKGDMLRYYGQISSVALPYFKDRPVTLRVYPQGAAGISYYMRD